MHLIFVTIQYTHFITGTTKTHRYSTWKKVLKTKGYNEVWQNEKLVVIVTFKLRKISYVILALAESGEIKWQENSTF